MYGYIYKTTNLINGKVYIGQHKSQNLKDNYLGSGKLLRKAINKYGINNFVKEIICICDNKNELNEKEIYWIEYYNSRNLKLGYNITEGGSGGDTFTGISEEARKIRINKLKKNSFILNCSEEEKHLIALKIWEKRIENGNIKHSKETILKLSASHKGHKPSKESIEKGINTKRLHNYHHSEETKKKISLGNKGKKKNISLEKRKNINEKIKIRMLGKNNHFYGKHHTEKTKKLIGEKSGAKTKNTIWMNNKIHSIRINKNEMENYLNLGYILGRIKWKHE